jgi:hypothetical protein
MTSLVVDPLSMQGSDQAALDHEALKEIVSAAHRQNLSVWVVLDVHQRLGMSLKPEWMGNMVVSANSGHPDEAAVTARPDVTHPDYQAYLGEMVKAFAASGCDGVFVPARTAQGFAREFSIESFRAFSSSFGLSVLPQQVLAADQAAGAPAEGRTAVYWRWVGWKALSYAKLGERLGKILRETNPTATVLVEVHRATLTAPLHGLEQYGEDIAELIQRTSRSMAVRHEGDGGEAVFDLLAQQLGSTDRLWVEAPLVPSTDLLSAEDLKRGLAGLRESGRWNTLLRAGPATAIP